ncbi:DMT family transporter [Paenibacillus sp. GCM10027627]|uniref:DMT family transporter n=1 Tax=unclassified Paenibacillus TaxID=185978 RepID=UPI003634E8A2
MIQLLLFGVSTALLWSFADIFIARATVTVKPVLAAGIVNIGGALLYALFYMLTVNDRTTLEISGIIYGLGGGAFIAFASMFFFVALARGPIGISSAISSTYPAGTLPLAVFLFGASIQLPQVLGVAMVAIGVALASGLLSKRDGAKRQKGASGPVMALFAAAGWAVGYALLAESVALIGWRAATLFQMAAVGFIFVVVLIARHNSIASSEFGLRSAIRNKWVIGAMLTQLAGGLLLNIGLEYDTSGGSIIVAVSACYPILTTAYAYFYLHERVPATSMLGGLLGIIGVVVLSV